MSKYTTGDGRTHRNQELAQAHANAFFNRTGVIIAVEPVKSIKHEKLTPTLPAGHRWRNDYVLCANPGTHRQRIYSGYSSLPAARKDAVGLIRERSATEVSIVRYSQGAQSIRDHVVEIVATV
jgi:monoamine oxidase